jgi:outer membrane protein OmpA-like peptidoglycan-associated protein
MSFYHARCRRGSAMPRLAALVTLAGLAACSPVEGYRHVSGLDKNDPDPSTAPYTDSLAKGLAEPYPNLASVPAPPVVGSTTAERQKLAEALTSQRGSAQAPDAQGKPGSASAGPVPPMPPLPPAVEAPAAAPAAMAEASPPPEPGKARPLHTVRDMNEPPDVTGPVEAQGQSPLVPAVPNAEAVRSAPRAAALAAVPRAAPPNAAIAPGAVESAQPQPTPEPAVLPEPQPSPEAAAKPPPKLPPVGATVASLDVSSSGGLSGGARAQLDPVVAAYKEKPTTVRVVAYAASAGGSAEQLNSFRLALDRAQAVAKLLTDAGIPAGKIQTEATPAESAAPAGRVEVRLMP